MEPCKNPDHPHCTVWVMPGEDTCAHGHPQPRDPVSALPAVPAVPVPAMRRTEPEGGGPVHASNAPIDTPHSHVSVPPIDARAQDHTPTATPAPSSHNLARPHLHVSGFDPRAAGGRQLLKLELRGMPPGGPARLTLLTSSHLHLEHEPHQAFERNARGDWLPLFIGFSSRGLEHGQYRIELELFAPAADDRPARAWTATLGILVPRADASLFEIHQTYLATHRNVRVLAEDASIARVRGHLEGGGRVDIDVAACNAGIAHLDLDTGDGKIDLGFASIAWDEELFEIDLAPGLAPPVHPCPAARACVVADGPEHTGRPRHLRLFALEEWVLGRREPGAQADILLAHHDGKRLVDDGLTRRLSARHAVIRRTRAGFEIEDVSRYGLLVAGTCPGKHAPLALQPGARIELTASIPGIVVLEVAALQPHALVLRRIDAGNAEELLYLVEPEHAPTEAPKEACAPPPGLPLLFHRDGGFWLRDAASGAPTPLGPGATLPGAARFTAHPYPDLAAALPAALSVDSARTALPAGSR